MYWYFTIAFKYSYKNANPKSQQVRQEYIIDIAQSSGKKQTEEEEKEEIIRKGNGKFYICATVNVIYNNIFNFYAEFDIGSDGVQVAPGKNFICIISI